MDYESVGKIIGALLALLFLIYARNKMRSPKNLGQNPLNLTVDRKPDIISRAASGILKAHELISIILGIIIIGVVIGLAFFDSLTRIIVLSTIGLMLVIGLAGRWFRKRKMKKLKSPSHVQIIE
jgi:hypothetical protein